MKCPHCNNQLLQRSGDLIKARIKGKIEFVDNLCKTNCYWCGKKVEFYFPIDNSILEKAIETKNRFIINR